MTCPLRQKPGWVGRCEEMISGLIPALKREGSVLGRKQDPNDGLRKKTHSARSLGLSPNPGWPWAEDFTS